MFQNYARNIAYTLSDPQHWKEAAKLKSCFYRVKLVPIVRTFCQLPTTSRLSIRPDMWALTNPGQWPCPKVKHYYHEQIVDRRPHKNCVNINYKGRYSLAKILLLFSGNAANLSWSQIVCIYITFGENYPKNEHFFLYTCRYSHFFILTRIVHVYTFKFVFIKLFFFH